MGPCPDRDLLEALRGLLEGKGAYRVWLVGSRARNGACSRADYDLALWTERPLSLAELGWIRLNLEDLPIPEKVDLIYLNLSPGFFRVVEEEGVLLERTGAAA